MSKREVDRDADRCWNPVRALIPVEIQVVVDADEVAVKGSGEQ